MTNSPISDSLAESFARLALASHLRKGVSYHTVSDQVSGYGLGHGFNGRVRDIANEMAERLARELVDEATRLRGEAVELIKQENSDDDE